MSAQVILAVVSGAALGMSILALRIAARAYAVISRSRRDVYGRYRERGSVIRKKLAIDELGYLQTGARHLFCEYDMDFCGVHCPYFGHAIKNGITGSTFDCPFQDTKILCPDHYTDTRRDTPTPTPERDEP